MAEQGEQDQAEWPDQADQADQSEQAEPSGDLEPGEAAEQFEAKPEDDEIEEIEAEREKRLDPENRPDGVEIDNTQRDFDAEKGMFTDAEGYDEADKVFPPVEEQDT